jgi:predicted RNase H-like HicB family nuclease
MKNKIKTFRKDDTTESPAEGYLYTVNWSEDDEAYLVRAAEFPSLTAHGDSRKSALRSMHRVVNAVLKDLAVSNEPTPQPLNQRTE